MSNVYSLCQHYLILCILWYWNNFMVFEANRSYFISLKVSPSLPSQSQAQLAASAIFLNANYNELAHILHYIFLLEIFAIYNIVSANSNCLLCM